MNKLVYVSVIALLTATPLYSQRPRDHGEASSAEAQSGMQAARMIMPTNNAKVFRLVRPVVAAVQVKLAEAGLFRGRINGLYGPSTRDAVAAYQKQQGLTVTGLVTLEVAVGLLALDPATALAEYRDRLDLMATGMAGMAGMAGETPDAMPAMQGRGAMVHEGAKALPGDPADANALAVMERPGRANDHTRAVPSVLELVAAFQIKLAEEGHYEGAIDGSADGPNTLAALRSYQDARGLEGSGRLDFSTALSLLGLARSEVESKYGDAIGLDRSPVAHDAELLRRSDERLQRLIGASAMWGNRSATEREDE